MPERALVGTPASPGVALGAAWHLREAIDAQGRVPRERREAEREVALAALAASAQSLHDLASEMSAADAAIVETGVLMAQDPALLGAVEDAIMAGGLTAAAAIIRAADEHASAIAAIGDETLAARADDVRSLGRRAARLTAGRQGMPAPPGADLILIAHDVGPADVAELAHALGGIALAAGGATAHAAIVARSLGIAMVTGLGGSVLEVGEGAEVFLDGSTGELALDPSDAQLARARGDMRTRKQAARRAQALRDEPAMTTDGVQLKVLANVASPEELGVALQAGAEGIGLLRTELAFLDAEVWPSQDDHLAALNHILGVLPDGPAVVRVLDFGADKCPPFLRGVPYRGLELLLRHREAFSSQIAAILVAAQAHDVRILLPLVDTPAQLTEALALIDRVAHRHGAAHVPPLGSMIETPLAADNAGSIAGRSAFLSIGTNDLTASTLGLRRLVTNAARAHHPHVLRAIARSVEAAHAAGIPVEVCGEAASDATMLPLLVGLGVDELSVGAARVGQVRQWIRQLDSVETAGLARSTLTMDSAEEVEWTLRPVAASLQSTEPASPIHAVGS